MRPILLIAAATLVWGCGSEATPEVEILEVNPATIVATDDEQNDVRMTVHYVDGDADLGDGFAEIHDCRVEGLVSTLALPPIANESAVQDEVAIEGDMKLLVGDIAIVEEGTPGCAAFGQAPLASGQLSLCVVLVDAAGHRSNADCTDPIALSTP
jgi:hypothetical protein